MREIKFRAWHEESKTMHDVKGIDFVHHGGLVDMPMFGYAPLKKVILMQYTGLKDKNGKEIYAGDIILLGKAVRHIEYDRGSFTLFAGDRRLSPISDYNSEGNYEVIGNIYENPELLEEASVQNN